MIVSLDSRIRVLSEFTKDASASQRALARLDQAEEHDSTMPWRWLPSMA